MTIGHKIGGGNRHGKSRQENRKIQGCDTGAWDFTFDSVFAGIFKDQSEL